VAVTAEPRTDADGEIDVRTPGGTVPPEGPQQSGDSTEDDRRTPPTGRWHDVLLLRVVVAVAVLGVLVAAFGVVTELTASVPVTVLAVGVAGGVAGGALSRLTPRPQRPTQPWSTPAVAFVTGLVAAGGVTAVLLAAGSLPSLVAVSLVTGALTAVLIHPPAYRWESVAGEQYSAIDAYRRVVERSERRLNEAVADRTATEGSGADLPAIERQARKGRRAIEASRASLSLAAAAVDERRTNDFLQHYYTAKRQFIPLRLTIAALETGPASSEPRLAVSLTVSDGPTTLTHTSGRGGKTEAAWLLTQCSRLLNLAETRLGSHEVAHVRRLLTTTDGRVKPDVDESAVMEAAMVLQDAYRRRGQRLRTLSRLLRVGILVGVVGVVVLLSVVPIPAVAASVPQVALFGLFGATTSTILSLRAVSTRIDTDPSLPDPSIDLEMTIARLLFGVIAAIALYVMLVGGVLNPALVTGSGGGGLVLAVAFAAGFSERLLVNATERFVDAVGDDD
jgi:hypothetical protein